MTDIDEKLINKIRKLLALGTSPNEHEAARAMEKAQELLLRYNLSMSDLGSVTEQSTVIQGALKTATHFA